MQTTSYVHEEDTFSSGYAQQYRLIKYIKDILQNWFSDKNNIKDSRLSKFLYQTDGTLKSGVIRLNTAFNRDQKYTGSTPAITVSLNNITFSPREATMSGIGDCNPMNATKLYHNRKKIFTLSISVITQDYQGCILLAELVSMFLLINIYNIQRDCAMLSQFDVLKLDAPTVVETNTQSKQVYGSNITMVATGFVCWTQDTQGPVFKGITKTTFGTT